MAASKNSRNSRRFSGALASPAASVALCALACAVTMACAAWYFYRTGATLYYGDAEAHLNIARRIIDSRTPGLSQLGTTWLPLPHLLMLPFVRHDELWTTGLAGAIPAAIAMAMAGTFLFAAVRRALDSTLAATVATIVFLLNPNTLYLGSIPMSEPFYYAALFALLYFTVRFGETRGWGTLVGAAIAASAASLTRYEGWFLIPFAAAYILARGKGVVRRSRRHILFCIIASIGPALWMAHNRWYFGDPLYFYRGPWSAAAIQGTADYPGRGDWHVAIVYFFEAAKLFVGLPALLIGAAGADLRGRTAQTRVLACRAARVRAALLHLEHPLLLNPDLCPHTDEEQFLQHPVRHGVPAPRRVWNRRPGAVWPHPGAGGAAGRLFAGAAASQ